LGNTIAQVTHKLKDKAAVVLRDQVMKLEALQRTVLDYVGECVEGGEEFDGSFFMEKMQQWLPPHLNVLAERMLDDSRWTRRSLVVLIATAIGLPISILSCAGKGQPILRTLALPISGIIRQVYEDLIDSSTFASVLYDGFHFSLYSWDCCKAASQFRPERAPWRRR
jgi:hypothetical protein